MAFLLWLLAALVLFVLGKGTLHIIYRDSSHRVMGPADCIPVGGMICIGLAEVAHLGAVILGWSFSLTTKVFCISVAVCVLMVIWGGWHCRRKNGRRMSQTGKTITGLNRIDVLLWGIFALLVLVQAAGIVRGNGLYLQGDMTLETVNSFLTSDGVYTVNPMTGDAYVQGIPMRLKILCLPTLYGALCTGMGVPVATVVCCVVPVLVLLVCYCVYYTLAGYLFGQDCRKRIVFLICVALLLGAGDYLYGTDGFGILHSGFRGVSIRAAVLIPYTVGLVLRKQYKLVVLCVLAEACIVWTFYGLGSCILVAAGLAVVDKFLPWVVAKCGGKEDDTCRN